MENIAKNCNDELTSINKKTLRIRIWLKFPANSGHPYLNRKSHTQIHMVNISELVKVILFY